MIFHVNLELFRGTFISLTRSAVPMVGEKVFIITLRNNGTTPVISAQKTALSFTINFCFNISCEIKLLTPHDTWFESKENTDADKATYRQYQRLNKNKIVKIITN